MSIFGKVKKCLEENESVQQVPTTLKISAKLLKDFQIHKTNERCNYTEFPRYLLQVVSGKL